MKTKGFIVLAAAMMAMASCEQVQLPADDTTNGDGTEATAGKTKKFTFTCKGDFDVDMQGIGASTRGYLQADGKDLTHLWVFDYMGDDLQQQLVQSDNTADDFGRPSMQLKLGTHHIYFVASRGTEPTLGDGVITWTKPLDTFWADYEVTVTNTSNGNRAVTLARAITKMCVTISDALPATAARFAITPATWYTGINIRTGLPTAAVTAQTFYINIPSNKAGTSGAQLTLCSLSPADDWTTDIAIAVQDANATTLGTATITGVPFKQNRCTNLTGKLFSQSTTATVSLSTDWLTATDVSF